MKFSEPFLDEGGNKTFWDEKEGIIRSVYVGAPTVEIAKKILLTVDQLIKKYGDSCVLVDLRKTGKPDRETRVILTKILDIDGMSKIAYLISNVIIRVVLGFIISRAHYENYKVFEKEKDALKWLKEP